MFQISMAAARRQVNDRCAVSVAGDAPGTPIVLAARRC
jgi:hypothetical protein